MVEQNVNAVLLNKVTVNDVNSWANFLGIGSYLLVGIVGVIVAVAFCVLNIEKVMKFQSWIAKIFTAYSKRSRKATVASDIRSKAIKAAKSHKGLDSDVIVQDLKIEWVKEEDIDAFIKNGQVILKLNHKENPHKNFVTAVSTYVNQALLSKAKKYIDQDVIKTSTLAVARSIIVDGDMDAVDYFDEYILKPIIDDNEEILELMQEIKEIDGNGMFYEILLNEYAKAGKVLFPSIKIDPCFTAESREFLHFLHRIAAKIENDPNGLCFNREYFKVDIFLTANDFTLKKGGTDLFVKKIFQAIKDGIETIYVFGLGRKIEVARNITQQIQGDFRVANVKYHRYNHRRIDDGKRIKGICCEINIYKNAVDE